MSTEKKKEQQLLEDVTAQPAVQSSYSTAGLNSRKEVENALTNAVYTPGQSVTDAAADLRNWQKNRPGKYESAYQGRIEDLIGQLLERNSFQYSYAQDPLYRQYAQQYTQNARNASADAAAQAAALTGGYGSSYAASVAQQAYQQQLGALNDALPSLYRLALDTYNSEGDDVVTRIDQLNTQEQNAQAQYNAELSDYYSQLDRKGSAYNAAYEQDYGRYQDYLGRLDTLYGYYSNQEQQAIAKRKQAFNGVLSILGVIGDAAGQHRIQYVRERPRLRGRACRRCVGPADAGDPAAGQPCPAEVQERAGGAAVSGHPAPAGVQQQCDQRKAEYRQGRMGAQAVQGSPERPAGCGKCRGKECGQFGRLGQRVGAVVRRQHHRTLQRRPSLPAGQERYGHPQRTAEGGLLQR